MIRPLIYLLDLVMDGVEIVIRTFKLFGNKSGFRGTTAGRKNANR